MTGCGRKHQVSEQFCFSSAADLLCVYFPSLGLSFPACKIRVLIFAPSDLFQDISLAKNWRFYAYAIQLGLPGMALQVAQVECVLPKDAHLRGE